MNVAGIPYIQYPILPSLTYMHGTDDDDDDNDVDDVADRIC